VWLSILGRMAARAGRSTPPIMPRLVLAATQAAPVLPAVTMAAARPLRTSSAHTDSDEFRLPRSTETGGSSMPTTSVASTSSSPLGSDRSLPISRLSRRIGPTRRTSRP
jgi:hypothetical protein